VLYRTNAQSRSIEDALRKQDIPYRIFGGLSFYQRKEIKDVVAYLRLIVNPNDEEALVRVINYPARGIGDTTIEKLTVAANHYKRSIFEVMQHLDKIDLKLNKPTIQRLEDFVTMIQSFQVLNQTYDAFDLASHVARKSGLLQELKKDGTPEGISRIDNIEELLNGIKDFIEGQKEVEGATGSLTEFLEDVSLASDLDKGLPNEDKVSLMTIHMAKGLEFPHVFIVGLEEDLFPSAMSLNTRSDLEEERRLFYVALTRAEKRAYLSFAQSRYRWGKLTDAEPSRFIEEIDDKYLDFQMPNNPPRFKQFVNNDIFGEPDLSKLRLSKPVAGTPPKGPTQEQIRKLRKLKPDLAQPLEKANLFDNQLVVGNIVMHERFGKGEILALEGAGGDRKAEIKFEPGGVKKLLLRFAKLKVLG
jgi:DNA helicase-2/ATP-dependent DNA helicase PcrA